MSTSAPPTRRHLGFFEKTLQAMLDNGDIRKDMSVLILCGGTADKNILENLQFSNVTISNLDPRVEKNRANFAPYDWAYLDAEAIDRPDQSYDLCIVHSGLHHCRSPHLAMIEMYRVARVGVLLFEPLDSFFTRITTRLGFGQEYELAAVFTNDGKFGGFRGGEVPNFVYRFSANEIRKTIQTAAPYSPHRYRFFYALRLPVMALKYRRNKLPYYLLSAAMPFLSLIARVFPSFGNNLGAWIPKPALEQDHFPWLQVESDAIRINSDYLKSRYGASEA